MSLPANAAAPAAQTGLILFLSHAGADTEAAQRLAKRIEGAPEAHTAGLKVWLDKEDLVPGQSWQKQLGSAIEVQSTAFAVYVGASGVINWVESEVELALSRARKEPGYHFIPVISANSSTGALPPFARRYQAVRNVETDQAEFAKLTGPS